MSEEHGFLRAVPMPILAIAKLVKVTKKEPFFSDGQCCNAENYIKLIAFS